MTSMRNPPHEGLFRRERTPLPRSRWWPAAIAVLGGVVGLAAACAGSSKNPRTPQACMESCEKSCPGKGGGAANFDKYISCVDTCEDRCG